MLTLVAWSSSGWPELTRPVSSTSLNENSPSRTIAGLSPLRRTHPFRQVPATCGASKRLGSTPIRRPRAYLCTTSQACRPTLATSDVNAFLLAKLGGVDHIAGRHI
jgi:hypothetical protein